MPFLPLALVQAPRALDGQRQTIQWPEVKRCLSAWQWLAGMTREQRSSRGRVDPQISPNCLSDTKYLLTLQTSVLSLIYH